MEAELRTQVNFPVVLINREGLYVIIAVLGVSILGCACVLTYSFTNYTKLKKNAEEVRSYISSKTKVAGQAGTGDKHVAAGAKTSGHPKSRDGGKRVAGLLPSGASDSVGGGPVALAANDTYAILAKQGLEEEMMFQKQQPPVPRDDVAKVMPAELLDQSRVVPGGSAAAKPTSVPKAVPPAA
ncbi:unnamed protein product [Ixodes hexagonus]